METNQSILNLLADLQFRLDAEKRLNNSWLAEIQELKKQNQALNTALNRAFKNRQREKEE